MATIPHPVRALAHQSSPMHKLCAFCCTRTIGTGNSEMYEVLSALQAMCAGKKLTLMPERAMEPKRKVVMPPITQVGVLAKNAPICTARFPLSSQCDRLMQEHTAQPKRVMYEDRTQYDNQSCNTLLVCKHAGICERGCTNMQKLAANAVF